MAGAGKLDRDEIKAKNKIADVIGRTVKLAAKGSDLIGLCPFHDDHDPSLGVFPATNTYKCFACNEAGDVISWVMKRDKVDFRTALATLAGVDSDASKGKKNLGEIIKVYQYKDLTGAVRHETVRFEPKDFRQRRPNPDKPGEYIWSLKGIERIPFDLTRLVDAVKHGKHIHITEGEKDAHAVQDVGAEATTNPQGGLYWPKEFGRYLKGVDVTVWQDKDPTGQKRTAIILASLRGFAKSVRVVEAKVGKDASDHLAGGFRLDQAIEVAVPEVVETTLDLGKKRLDLPQIVVNNRQARDIVDDAIHALAKSNIPPRMFHRAGRLVHVEADEECNWKIKAYDKVTLRTELYQSADWIKATGKDKETDEDTFTNVWPPKDVSESILPQPLHGHGFRNLKGLSASPVLSPFGDFASEHGYDPGSGYFITDKGPWPAWSGTVEEARDFLFENLLVDFPFENEASRANALALMLTFFVKSIIGSPIPMFFFDAPTAGTGKTLCAQLCGYPSTGKFFPVVNIPEREDEFAKLLFSLLFQGAPVIFFDNHKGVLSSPSLEACLTASVYQARLLGVSSAPEVAVSSLFILTANNGRLSKDAVRRCVHIRLNAKMERPVDRTEFKHKNISAWARENRLKLTAAVQKIISHWNLLGQPAGSQHKATYEDWSQKIGGMLEACGVAGFLANDRDLMNSANDEDEQWRPLYEAWKEHPEFSKRPVENKELCEWAVREHLCDFIFDRCKSERGYVTALGTALGKRKGIPLAGCEIERSTIQRGLARFNLVPCGGLVDLFSTPRVEIKNSTPSDLFSESADTGMEKAPPLHHLGSNTSISGGPFAPAPSKVLTDEEMGLLKDLEEDPFADD